VAKKLTEEEVEAARALKKVMSWNKLAALYRMNRWTLMYQIAPEKKREEKRAKMRETNRRVYHEKKVAGTLQSRRRAYKNKFGLDWEHVAEVRRGIRQRMRHK
jgi:hypothetical protein